MTSPAIAGLLDRSRWAPSSVAERTLVAHVDAEEAARLREDASAREALESFLRTRRSEPWPISGLLMLVRGTDHRFCAFIELTIDAEGRCVWHGLAPRSRGSVAERRSR